MLTTLACVFRDGLETNVVEVIVSVLLVCVQPMTLPVTYL